MSTTELGRCPSGALCSTVARMLFPCDRDSGAAEHLATLRDRGDPNRSKRHVVVRKPLGRHLHGTCCVGQALC